MSEWAPWIPAGALIISVGTLLFAALGLRNKATKDYVEQLKDQLAASEEESRKCHELLEQYDRERKELRADNYELMRRIIGMPAKKAEGGA